LGNTSYRILRVEQGRVRVEDAEGLPPSIPFWLGEAPARTDEVSAAVSRLRQELQARLDELGAALRHLTEEIGLSAEAAQQIVDYFSAAKAVLGLLPTSGTWCWSVSSTRPAARSSSFIRLTATASTAPG